MSCSKKRVSINVLLKKAMIDLKDEIKDIENKGFKATDTTENPYHYYKIFSKKFICPKDYFKFLEHQRHIIWMQGFYSKMKKENEICLFCKKQINSESNREQLYCSKECMNKYHLLKKEKNSKALLEFRQMQKKSYKDVMNKQQEIHKTEEKLDAPITMENSIQNEQLQEIAIEKEVINSFEESNIIKEQNKDIEKTEINPIDKIIQNLDFLINEGTRKNQRKIENLNDFYVNQVNKTKNASKEASIYINFYKRLAIEAIEEKVGINILILKIIKTELSGWFKRNECFYFSGEEYDKMLQVSGEEKRRYCFNIQEFKKELDEVLHKIGVFDFSLFLNRGIFNKYFKN